MVSSENKSSPPTSQFLCLSLPVSFPHKWVPSLSNQLLYSEIWGEGQSWCSLSPPLPWPISLQELCCPCLLKNIYGRYGEHLFYSPYHHFSASKSNVIIRLNHMKLTFFSDTNSHIFTIHVFQPKFFFLLFPNSLVLHYSKRSPLKTHIWSYFTLVSPLQWFSTVPLIVSKFLSVTYGILLSCSLLISLASFFGSFHPCNFAHLDPGLLYV